MNNLNMHFQPKNYSDKVALYFTKFLRLLADTFFKKRYGHRAVAVSYTHLTLPTTPYV